MNMICPTCEATRDVTESLKKLALDIHGERIEVDSKAYVCSICHTEFETTRSPDALKDAYRIYRDRHNLLQPEDILSWRTSLGLTQREVAGLLGWGGATLSRYECGSLQDEAHDRTLRLLQVPDNLISTIEATPEALEEGKRERLLHSLRSPEKSADSMSRVSALFFGHYGADELSGDVEFSLRKFESAILYFCVEGQLKTKLNKLLFYADFLHFREYGKSITGARYVALPYGPVPDNYEYYYAPLVGRKSLRVEEKEVGPYTGEEYVTSGHSDLSLFSETELKILATVKELFKDKSASEMRDLSHDEAAYKLTPKGDLISYVHAKVLSI